MNNPLRTCGDYELFLYTLTEKYPSVLTSTIVFIRKGKTLARVTGELYFEQEIRVVIRERLICGDFSAVIDWYGYEVWKGSEKLYWYDSQPHPDDMSLASTHPHHKHIPPNMKQNRIPAPNMSFIYPNLPALIREIEDLMNRYEHH